MRKCRKYFMFGKKNIIIWVLMIGSVMPSIATAVDSGLSALNSKDIILRMYSKDGMIHEEAVDVAVALCINEKNISSLVKTFIRDPSVDIVLIRGLLLDLILEKFFLRNDIELSDCLKKIKNKDEDERIVATLLLGYICSELSTEGDVAMVDNVLIKTLDDSSLYVKGCAVFALGYRNGPLDRGYTNSVPKLFEMTLHSDPNIRRESALALGLTPKGSISVVKRLVELLEPLQPIDVRIAAAYSMSLQTRIKKTTESSIIRSLILAIDDKNSHVKKYIAISLGNIGFPAQAAVKKLGGLMSDKDPSVRENVAEAIGRICACRQGNFWGAGFYPGEDYSDEEVPVFAKGVIDNALKALVTGLDDAEFKVRNTSAEALGLMGRNGRTIVSILKEKGYTDSLDRIYADIPVEDNVENIIKGLMHENRYVRKNAIFAANKSLSVDDNLMQSLVKGLSDQDLSNGRGAAKSLAQRGAAAVPYLVRALKSGNSLTVSNALFALAVIGPDAGDAKQSILKCLFDTDKRILIRACEAATKVGLESYVAVPELTRILKQSTDSQVQSEVAEALAYYGSDSKESIGSLLSIVLENKGEVAADILSAMAQIGIDDGIAVQLSEIKPSESSNNGIYFIKLLFDFPEACLKFLINNDSVVLKVSERDELYWTQLLNIKSERYERLREYVLTHKDVPTYLLAYSGEIRFLPRVCQLIAESDDYQRIFYMACARALGDEPRSVVEISRNKPGMFKPASATPGFNKDRLDPSDMSGFHELFDGAVKILVTGKMVYGNGDPVQNPEFYNIKGNYSVPSNDKKALPISYFPETGRFCFYTRISGVFSEGKSIKKPGPFVTLSSDIRIVVDGAEPLKIQFYDEMPDVKITF